MVDYLIVGAGLFGATCARLLADAGKRAVVLERRDRVGGNCADHVENGVRVSEHGGHVFHTNSERIWKFVHRFADWLPYVHRVRACANGQIYSFPPNTRMYEQLGTDDPEAIKQLFFAGYTAKQWGRPLDQVDPSVLSRIPFRDNDDDRYFTDAYQGLPSDGYSAMIARILDGIGIETGTDYLDDEHYWNNQAEHVIYTGPLDAYYRYDLGKLAYRSLRFETRVADMPDFQGCATMNYTTLDVPYTRIMEWRHWWPLDPERGTTITTEYPEADGELYYPVNNDENNALYTRYATRAAKASWLHVGGRLGAYRYYNMDQAIGAAMALVGRLSNG